MALITTVSGSTSNSFATVNEADAYVADHNADSIWPMNIECYVSANVNAGSYDVSLESVTPNYTIKAKDSLVIAGVEYIVYTDVTTDENGLAQVTVTTELPAISSGATVTIIQESKRKSLRLACQKLSAMYAMRWNGRRASASQALPWPRFGVIDQDGYTVDSSSVPGAVKQAQIELALRIQNGDDVLVDVDPGIKSESVKAGPVEQSVTYVSNKNSQKLMPLIDKILTGLITSGNSLMRA